jgi:outer membrane protein OmpA-like peptidoglycan-associated protein
MRQEQMMTKTPLILALTGTLGLSACVTPIDNPNDPNANARSGAVMGGLVGAVAGAALSDDDKLKGALIGGALGAGAGALIGADLDRQAAELRSSLSSNISVTNTGEYLIVNMPQDLLFAVDSATLRPDLRRDLNTVAASLLKYPNSRIEVIGHTDNTGAAAYNQDLSQRRAVSVAQVLRDSGVPAGRIASYGRGEDQPIASNLTPEGRAQNRRVEIIIRPIR